MNGKILKFLADHWRGAVLVLGLGIFCASCLYCCQNGAELVVKGNKVTITKSKSK